MVPPVRVLVCDDNERVRLTLVRALSYKPDIEVVGEVGSFEELSDLLVSAAADVILLDVNMPGLSGLEGLTALRADGFSTPVIVMSAESRHEVPALEAGAASFFYKGSTDMNALVGDLRTAAGSRTED